jgi:hypothetical protein
MKALIKILFFCFILVFLQILISSRSAPEIPSTVALIKKPLPKATSIVGLGDSSIKFSYEKDIDTTTYSILRDVSGKEIFEVLSPAYHVGIYEHFFKYIAKNHPSVKYVLVPINLRSFSTQWDMNPAYEFKKETAFLNGNAKWIEVFFRPLSVFKFFSPDIDESEYHNTRVFKGTVPVGKVKDFLTRNYDKVTPEYFKDKMIFHYMYDLKPDHRKLRSIARMIKAGKKFNVTPVFFIAPVDHENGSALLGNEFTVQINKNVKTIRSVIDSNHGKILDLSTALGKNYFYWYYDEKAEYSPNEHLTYQGKLLVAQKLSELIK